VPWRSIIDSSIPLVTAAFAVSSLLCGGGEAFECGLARTGLGSVLAPGLYAFGAALVTLDLFGCYAKLLCDFGAFVSVHALSRPMIQRGAATR
jgi:hypothetical protein